ncbi:hypothetical protein TYRP_020340 [Tyrophagus putrescentiae]|nr:hypothetical protein TYRP_020340 [Tyrophagus putrescentiae]
MGAALCRRQAFLASSSMYAAATDAPGHADAPSQPVHCPPCLRGRALRDRAPTYRLASSAAQFSSLPLGELLECRPGGMRPIAFAASPLAPQLLLHLLAARDDGGDDYAQHFSDHSSTTREEISGRTSDRFDRPGAPRQRLECRRCELWLSGTTTRTRVRQPAGDYAALRSDLAWSRDATTAPQLPRQASTGSCNREARRTTIRETGHQTSALGTSQVPARALLRALTAARTGSPQTSAQMSLPGRARPSARWRLLNEEEEEEED